jgi:hypothetical protein
MAISGVGSTPLISYPNSPFTDFRQTYVQLVKAIRSGDLSGAQQAYAALTQLQASDQGPAADSSSPFAQALSKIGPSLLNGDIAGAQQALAGLQGQTRAHHHHHHHSQSSNDGTWATRPTAAIDAGATGLPTIAGNNVDLTA